MASNNLLHPRDRIPKPAPMINLEQGRFYITKGELHMRMDNISSNVGKIKGFAQFSFRYHHKIILESQFVYGDLEIFVKLLSQFLEKEFLNPVFLFKKVCGQFPIEFLLHFDLCRE